MILDNYHPISNLLFLEILTKKMVSLQVQKNLEDAYYLDVFQSDFRLGFSTETTLVSVIDDLWWKRDESSESIIVLLDFSVAFSSINHAILLNQPEGLEIGETVLY